MHESLKQFLNELRENNPSKRFPDFCSVHSGSVDNKRIIAVLQDPGGSSPEKKTNQCSVIINDDPTAKRQREVLDKVGLDPNMILFWNFFPFFGLAGSRLEVSDYQYWAGELSKLCGLLPKLRVIVVSGNEAWKGMRYFRPTRGISLVWTPHPSNRGMKQKGNFDQLMEGWRAAKSICNEH